MIPLTLSSYSEFLYKYIENFYCPNFYFTPFINSFNPVPLEQTIASLRAEIKTKQQELLNFRGHLLRMQLTNDDVVCLDIMSKNWEDSYAECYKEGQDYERILHLHFRDRNTLEELHFTIRLSNWGPSSLFEYQTWISNKSLFEHDIDELFEQPYIEGSWFVINKDIKSWREGITEEQFAKFLEKNTPKYGKAFVPCVYAIRGKKLDLY